MIHPKLRPLIFVFAVFLSAQTTRAIDVDTLTVVVDPTNTLFGGGTAIGTFGYDAATDSMYISTFGAGGNLHRISNVGGAQTASVMITATELQLYYRDGNPDRSVSNNTQSGLLLNPVAIGATPAYSLAILTDAATTNYSPTEPDNPNPGTSNTPAPALTNRVYSYNLQQVQPGQDGRDVLSDRVTLADMQSVAGITPTNFYSNSWTTSNAGRQPAWSGDGQSLYFIDTSANFGGVWKVSPTGPANLSRLYDATHGGTHTSTSDISINTEPAVIRAGNIDTIYFEGGGAVTNNTGGIDKITYDGVTASTRTIAVAGSVLADFLETTTADISIASMASDAAGNLYFNNTDSSPDRRGIFRLDPQGRLSKVVGFRERNSEFSVTNSNTLRMHSRTVSFAGSEGSFDITQILYAESAGANSRVAGVNVFNPGDFNRDNTLDADDITLFRPEITIGGAANEILAANADKLKFDMNGNNIVDWKDVKILGQFADFGAGDIDLNGVVDMADYSILSTNWLGTGKTYIQGDLSGDDLVNLDDYNLWAASAGFKSSVITGAQFMGVPGDFDGDLDVDGADFVAWQTHFPMATGGTLETGDADADGDIDGADFVVWQTNFPKSLPGPPGSPGVAPVPEPAAGGLAVAGVAFAAALQLRRRKRS